MTNRIKRDIAKEIAVKIAGDKSGIIAKALVKDNEQYLFVYRASNAKELLRVFGRFASNDSLSFTWTDAAIMSQKVRSECK